MFVKSSKLVYDTGLLSHNYQPSNSLVRNRAPGWRDGSAVKSEAHNQKYKKPSSEPQKSLTGILCSPRTSSAYTLESCPRNSTFILFYLVWVNYKKYYKVPSRILWTHRRGWRKKREWGMGEGNDIIIYTHICICMCAYILFVSLFWEVSLYSPGWPETQIQRPAYLLFSDGIKGVHGRLARTHPPLNLKNLLFYVYECFVCVLECLVPAEVRRGQISENCSCDRLWLPCGRC